MTLSIAKELQARLTKSKISYEELYGILQQSSKNQTSYTDTKSTQKNPHKSTKKSVGKSSVVKSAKKSVGKNLGQDFGARLDSSLDFTQDFAKDFDNRDFGKDFDIEEAYLQVELLRAQGLPLESSGDTYFLAHNELSWREQEFCFVDIETTGSKPQEHQIIEIGAIKWKNGKVLGEFSELIHAYFVPETIVEITQITPKMLENARKEREVLRDFREFLAQSVFVAHNVGFDYGFVSVAMEQAGLYKLLNPKLCTIDLARRTILAKRYSLQYLNEFLGINTPTSHRAYADALTALKVFEISLLSLPKAVHTTQDLIDFSKSAM